jgi:pyocin large subunit-like protein
LFQLHCTREIKVMAGLKTALGLALGISAAALLAACDNGPTAVRAKSSADAGSSASPSSSGGSDYRSSYASRSDSRSDGAPAVDHRKDDVKLVEGKPEWSPSRRFSAEENAQRAFERNGEAFGTRSIDQFIKKAHAFVDHPPAGTQTLTRANGDTLFYDPRGNVFAVASKAGAPRAMFKPDDGAAYWEKQKDRESHSKYARRSRGSQDDAT